MDGMLYRPGDAIWRVARESALHVLGGPRALLMQIAHPLIAAGVAHHSDFPRRPLRRLRRTLRSFLDVVFGDADERGRALARIERSHAPVDGRLPRAEGPFPAGTPYSAADAELRLWVLATLLDTGRVSFAHLVRPFTEADEREYLEQGRLLARVFGIEDRWPKEPAAFDAYLGGMLEGPSLVPSQDAGRLARAILEPPLLLFPRLLFLPQRLLTAGLLPPALRARYGLPWTRAHAAAFAFALALARAALPRLPGPLRFVPQARRAARRFTRGAAAARPPPARAPAT